MIRARLIGLLITGLALSLPPALAASIMLQAMVRLAAS